MAAYTDQDIKDELGLKHNPTSTYVLHTHRSAQECCLADSNCRVVGQLPDFSLNEIGTMIIVERPSPKPTPGPEPEMETDLQLEFEFEFPEESKEAPNEWTYPCPTLSPRPRPVQPTGPRPLSTTTGPASKSCCRSGEANPD